ncbi:uncharacterized protein [Typha angustifolia]|uniref:uncharacterized protein n=1 Tax=Typha angustifolia TaxID=59011 RepID=UPI003C2E796B
MVLCCAAASTSSPAVAVRCGVARKKAKQAKETSLSTPSLASGRKANDVAIADAAERRPLGFAGKKQPEPTWQCVVGCGACCKLDKGPAFPSPEEIFSDEPAQLDLYKSQVGEDGWCIHYEKATRTCAIYQERPLFCRVEPEVFKELFGIEKKRFNKEACRSCVAAITAAYGSASEELKNFNRTIRREGNKK